MRARNTAAAVTLLAALTACTTNTVGHPDPVEMIASETSGSKPEETDYSLARLCELLSPEEAQRLGGAPEGEEGNALNDGHTICTWADETGLVVGFQEGTTTAHAPAGPSITNTPTTIDGLPAVQSLNTDTVVICQVMVDLPSGRLFTSSARVRSAGEGKWDPCEVATKLSTLIIPRVKDQ